MKKPGILLTCILLLSVIASSQNESNDFYDDAEPYYLSGPRILEVSGEIENPGSIDLLDFPTYSVILKEAELTENGNRFIGAYRYDGVSLYDILNYFILKKKNRDEFEPIIDLYVEIENVDGERTLLSWGEIFYPVHHDEILIATQVARIVPSKTKDLWPLPEKTKLVVSSDLITERNISNPIKIRILSADQAFEVEKGMDPMYAPHINIYDQDGKIGKLDSYPEDQCLITYETTFYGRGKGIHSTTPFTGITLKDLISEYFPPTPESLASGYFIISAEDGYRAVFTYSEIMNRNDQSELLLIDEGEVNGGRFRLFPAFDFSPTGQSNHAIASITGE